MAAFRRRIKPVAGERNDAKAHLGAGEGLGQHPAVPRRQVEIVHRPGDVEIGIGVEPFDERDALVAQVAFHLEIGIEAEGDRLPVLKPSAELAFQGQFRKIGNMRRHARHRQATLRGAVLADVIALAPVGIGHDGLAADLVKGDVLRRMARRRGDGGEGAVRELGHELQHLHAAHGAADHREQFPDPQMIKQKPERADHVADCDHRKIKPPGPAGLRVGFARAGGAHAAAQDIGANDEVAIGVEDLAGADHHFPPAGLAGDRMGLGHVLIPGKRVADQDGVGAVFVQGPVGLVGDGEVDEIDAAVQAQRLLPAQPHPVARQGSGVKPTVCAVPTRAGAGSGHEAFRSRGTKRGIKKPNSWQPRPRVSMFSLIFGAHGVSLFPPPGRASRTCERHP